MPPSYSGLCVLVYLAGMTADPQKSDKDEVAQEVEAFRARLDKAV